MIKNDSISQSSNPLTQPLLSTIKVARTRADELQQARELIRVSVGLLAEQSTKIDRLEATNLHLRAQLQAAVSGRTVGEERQAIEREQLDAANGDDECSERNGSRRAA